MRLGERLTYPPPVGKEVSMQVDCLDELSSRLSLLERKLEGDEEGLEALHEARDLLADPEPLALACIRRVVTRPGGAKRLADALRREGEFREFVEYVRRPWIANKALATAAQLLWAALAAIAFMMGIYLFFPAYVFFGGGTTSSATLIQGVLELILKNPSVLRIVDPLFKVLGIAMFAVAVVSLHQAHSIGSQGEKR